MSTRQEMLRAGYRAIRTLCGDPNGGLGLVDGWVIVEPDEDTPRPGAVMGGFRTRRAAWLSAEDMYEQRQAWIER